MREDLTVCIVRRERKRRRFVGGSEEVGPILATDEPVPGKRVDTEERIGEREDRARDLVFTAECHEIFITELMRELRAHAAAAAAVQTRRAASTELFVRARRIAQTRHLPDAVVARGKERRRAVVPVVFEFEERYEIRSRRGHARFLSVLRLTGIQRRDGGE